MKKVFFWKVLVFLLLAAIAASGILIVMQFTALAQNSDGSEENGFERKYNILLLGKSAHESFLKQIYEGAKDTAEMNNAVLQLYTGKSNAEEISTQALLNYASYMDADGIIAYIDSDERLEIPKRADGSAIPLITVGTYVPELPQLSYIGINYSELGRMIAREILALAGKSGKVILLGTSQNGDTNYSNLMNGLYNTISVDDAITLKPIQFKSETSFSKEDFLRQQLASEEDLELIVCLTEESTILAAQSVRDLNLSGKVSLLGFGDGKDCLSYFEKNILTELISVKTDEIGKTAVSGIFEFISTGYANSFVTVEIQVLRSRGAAK